MLRWDHVLTRSRNSLDISLGPVTSTMSIQVEDLDHPSFLYYNPYQDEGTRHGHFSPHPLDPAGKPRMPRPQTPVHPHVAAAAAAAVAAAAAQAHSRASSLGYQGPMKIEDAPPVAGQVQQQCQTMMCHRPAVQKPSIHIHHDEALRQANLANAPGTADACLYPSTPALSISSSSVAGSPLSACDNDAATSEGMWLITMMREQGALSALNMDEWPPMAFDGADVGSWGISPPETPGAYAPRSPRGASQIILRPAPSPIGHICSEIANGPSIYVAAPRMPQGTTDQMSALLSAGGGASLSVAPMAHPQPTMEEVKPEFDDDASILANLSAATGNVRAEDSSVGPTNDPFPQLPTLCEGDGGECRSMLSDADAPVDGAAFMTDGRCRPEIPMSHVPPTFENLTDLDSEEDLHSNVHIVPADPTIQYLGYKRQRIVVSAFDGDTRFVTEADSEVVGHAQPPIFWGLPSPPGSVYSRRGSDDFDSMRSGRQRGSPSSLSDDADHHGHDHDARSHGTHAGFHSTAPYPTRSRAGASNNSNNNNNSSSNNNTSNKNNNDNNQADSSRDQSTSGGPSGSRSSDEGATQGPPASAPTSRRGRKQSLTVDPSKTFVCELCSRRFRRQEHLKRHYRSLHTQDKPFECTDCGKKFSRSDNLAQHARTHGSATVTLDVIDGSVAPDEQDSASQLGQAFYEQLYASIGSTTSSDSSSVPESDSPPPSEQANSRRKRRRED